ncbi:MAG: hypothetical protein P4L22_07680 [Candidatus Babeliales bacterium]|nr:hypothetical protein [Candidatus Babeliales bacterium]
MKTIKIVVFIFIILSFNQLCALHSRMQGQKILRITLVRRMPFLERFNIFEDSELKDPTFVRNRIPFKGDPENFRIYLNYNTENIFVVDEDNSDIIIFNKNGVIFKNSDQVKTMIQNINKSSKPPHEPCASPSVEIEEEIEEEEVSVYSLLED